MNFFLRPCSNPLKVKNEIIEESNEEGEEDTTVIFNANAACPSCNCECTTEMMTGNGNIIASPPTLLNNEDEFVDLLDIYNQSDLDNGIFENGKNTE